MNMITEDSHAFGLFFEAWTGPLFPNPEHKETESVVVRLKNSGYCPLQDCLTRNKIGSLSM